MFSLFETNKLHHNQHFKFPFGPGLSPVFVRVLLNGLQLLEREKTLVGALLDLSKTSQTLPLVSV
jgi:hypothetical protein